MPNTICFRAVALGGIVFLVLYHFNYSTIISSDIFRTHQGFVDPLARRIVDATAFVLVYLGAWFRIVVGLAAGYVTRHSPLLTAFSTVVTATGIEISLPMLATQEQINVRELVPAIGVSLALNFAFITPGHLGAFGRRRHVR